MVWPGATWSTADVARGWSRGLKANGVDVIDFRLDQRIAWITQHMSDDELKGAAVDIRRMASESLAGALYEYRPDLVVVIDGKDIPPEVFTGLRKRGEKIVLVHTESPYEDDRQLERAAHVDLNVLNDPTNLDRFAAVAPSTYLGHAYRPTVHCPGPVNPALASDFAFVGTGYQSRIDFMEAVDWTGVDVALGGNWQQLGEESPLRKFVAHDLEHCVENTEAVDLYRSAKASANLYRREAERPELAEGWAMGPREVELAATGTFFLREPRGEGDDVLSMVPTFDGPEDFESKLRWYLAHDDERQAVADKARAAIAGHTFAASAAHLLRLLDELNERTT